MSTQNNDTEYTDDGKLEYESPLLTKLKETPLVFKEPEGYFEKLREEITQKIEATTPQPPPWKKNEGEQEEKPKPKGLILTLLQPRYAVAAVLLAAIVIIGLPYMLNTKKAQLTQADIAEVIAADKIQGIDEEVLIETMATEQADEVEMVEEEHVEDEVIIEYLLENDVDLDLINEL